MLANRRSPWGHESEPLRKEAQGCSRLNRAAGSAPGRGYRMTEPQSSGLPGWFTPAAIAAVAWEVLGCVMYLMQVRVDPAALPADQRAVWDATPPWMTGAYALAVWV